jgi:hypothetical protein
MVTMLLTMVDDRADPAAVSALRPARPSSLSSSSLSPWRLVVALCLVAASAPAVAAATAVLLDFEGVGDRNGVGDYYGGGGGGPAQDHGVVFGASAVARVGISGGGTAIFHNAPSPSTAALFYNNASQAYVTVPGGFTALAFQYTSVATAYLTVYGGPNRTGPILGTLVLPAVCPNVVCGDPPDALGLWSAVTAPLFPVGAVARSAGLSNDDPSSILVDDMLIELAPPTASPTKSPTGSPTRSPTKLPTRSPTKLPTISCHHHRRRKGTAKRCVMLMKKKE